MLHSSNRDTLLAQEAGSDIANKQTLLHLHLEEASDHHADAVPGELCREYLTIDEGWVTESTTLTATRKG